MASCVAFALNSSQLTGLNLSTGQGRCVLLLCKVACHHRLAWLPGRVDKYSCKFLYAQKLEISTSLRQHNLSLIKVFVPVVEGSKSDLLCSKCKEKLM